MADLSLRFSETNASTSRSEDSSNETQTIPNSYEPIILRQMFPNRLFLTTDASGGGPTSLLQPLNLVGLENFTGFGGATGAFPLDFSTTTLNNSTHAQMVARNSAKNLKCPKCNWNYKYQDTLESHMREKHPDIEITCVYCLQTRPHPKLARGETYSCGYKPYRCELCGYSTTTKGNLSIHMQSDKHLHAMQEMPNPMIAPSPIHHTDSGDEKSLHCMICTNFSTDNVNDMIDHLESDRSRTCSNDITFLHGTYQCRLCPYNTNLKANFQLHMRTDKHIQRVQLVNHMREGSSTAGIAPSSLVCRLSAVKSLIQVRCRPCQEVLTCTKAVREHCESRAHQSRCAFVQVNTTSNASRNSSTTPTDVIHSQNEFEAIYLCKFCDFETSEKMNVIAHCQKHMPSSEDLSQNIKIDTDLSDEDNGITFGHDQDLLNMNEAAYCCSECEFFSKSPAELHAHEETGEHIPIKTEVIEEQCPLCPQKSSTLRVHLLDEHKISQEVVDKLMASTVASTSVPSDSSSSNFTNTTIYRYRCSQCAMAFKTEENLQSHSISHTFKTLQKCSKCSKTFGSIGVMKKHVVDEHTFIDEASSFDSENGDNPHCEICKENFNEKTELQSHLNSVEHLHKAKKILEDQGSNLQLSEQILALLQQPQSRSPATTSSSTNSLEKKPFRCNVCKLGYGQGSSLDIHLRSVAHQSRMTRLVELVANGDINPNKPVSEQPGITWAPQKTIGEMVKTMEVSGDGIQTGQAGSPPSMDATVHQMAALNNMFNMAHLFNMAQQTNTSTSPIPNFTNLSGLGALSQLPLNSNFDFNQHLNALFGSATTSDKPSSTPIPSTDYIQTPKNGIAFRKALEDYGFNLFSKYIDNLAVQKKKLDKIPEEIIPELASIDCYQCQKNFENIWALKNHCEEVHAGDIPEESVKKFAEKLKKVLGSIQVDVKPNLKRSPPRTPLKENSDGAPEAKKVKEEHSESRSGRSSTGVSTPKNLGSKKNETQSLDLTNQLTMMSMMTAAGFPFLSTANPFMSMMTPEMVQNMAASMSSLMHGNSSSSTGLSISNLPTSVTPTSFGSSSGSPQKRARTRITDDQLKILRQYFDINNSPSEQQIKEMSVKAQLPEKVIKHWFRNTLFKERQRDKDSPYNFNVPPQMSIDLDTYEKTGEARILPVKNEEEDIKNEPIIHQNESFALEKSPSITPESNQPQNTVENEPLTTSATSASTAVADFMANLSKAATAAAMTNYAACMNPFASFMTDDKALTTMLSGMNSTSTPSLVAQPLATSSSHSSSMTGRRANRTRFTDFQLRTLQQFFDKQAYPKDDDLEMLSKKLNLSPRVIVVWFQNARQKARKIYENQPNTDNNERFVRTPGCNFQCKRCSLVFQRYYELIQHQQKVCYINDDEGQQTDNKSVEENLDDDEKYLDNTSNTDQQGEAQTTTLPTTTNNEFNLKMVLSQLAANGITSNDGSNSESNNEDFFKLIASSKASSEAMLKMLKNREKKRNFYKRCPFCGLLFHMKEKLVDHIQNRHKDQPHAVELDVDNLPDAEDVPVITTQGGDGETNGHVDFSPLDLSCSGDQQQVFSPTISHSDNGEDGSGEDFYFRPTSSSPLSNLLQTGNPGSNPGSISSSRSPAHNSKRYRTHLTPLQVYVMKSLFNDYKTPSMTECDILGSHIGLNKRVVQVWFQNARAKERKARTSSSADEDQPKNTTTSCTLCNVEFNSRTTLQDHIFTTGHIATIKDRAGTQIRGSENEVQTIETPVEEHKQRAKAVRDTKKPTNGTLNCRSGLSSPTLCTAGSGMTQFPYNLMYGLQSAAGLPMLCDPNVIGTPIPALQIPQSVMQKIATELAQGKPSTKFTQDGNELQELSSKVQADDFRCVRMTETEVGWACTQCTNVFQQEAFLKNHQKLICNNCDGVFKLVQIHYECVPCSVKFGTQDEYRSHCDTLPHKTARTLLNPATTSIFA